MDTSVEKKKLPILINIITTLAVLAGIGIILTSLFSLDLASIIVGALLIYVAVEVRHFKQWALYAFIALMTLPILFYLYALVTGGAFEEGAVAEGIAMLVQLLIIGYFWTQRKLFIKSTPPALVQPVQ